MMTAKVTQEARPQLLRDTMKVYSDNLARLESVKGGCCEKFGDSKIQSFRASQLRASELTAGERSLPAGCRDDPKFRGNCKRE